MTDYCASNLPRPTNTQTYFWNQTQGRMNANTLLAPEFSNTINHNQFQITTRNSLKGAVEVSSSDNPVNMQPGFAYIVTDILSPVNFFLPSAGPSLLHGDCIKIVGFGAGKFDVAATVPQSILFQGNGYHLLSADSQYNQISFIYNKFGSNNYWFVFGLQGNFTGT